MMCMVLDGFTQAALYTKPSSTPYAIRNTQYAIRRSLHAVQEKLPLFLLRLGVPGEHALAPPLLEVRQPELPEPHAGGGDPGAGRGRRAGGAARHRAAARDAGPARRLHQRG